MTVGGLAESSENTARPAAFVARLPVKDVWFSTTWGWTQPAVPRNLKTPEEPERSQRWLRSSGPKQPWNRRPQRLDRRTLERHGPGATDRQKRGSPSGEAPRRKTNQLQTLRMQKCNALPANPKAVGASVLCTGTNGVRRPSRGIGIRQPGW